MPAFTYEITETVAVLSENARGWRKELNLVSWGGRDPKYDIREWSPEHDRMGKGVTLSDEEMKALVAALKKM
ncbi:MAG: YdbC family protein [Clostridia bacterium]|nr:YdbC family protein [Clostridia bacterium]MBR6360567.1 YdbC family protein [Clostridia bacterium]